MISKVHQASSLDAMLRYVYQEGKNPQVVSNTTVRRDMAGARQEILGEIKKHEALKKPVFHGILSLPIEESLTRMQWRKVVERYTNAMGYGSSAYVAVRHFDTDHEHVHIVASRIDVAGQVVKDSLEWVRSQEILREIEREYGLQIVPNSWEVDERRMGQAEYHTLQEGKALASDREGARAAIYAALEGTESVEEFVSMLGEQGVSLLPRVEQTGEVTGVAFKSGERYFAGNRVSRAYSWPRLKERIGYEHARDFDALVRAPEIISRDAQAPEVKAVVRESKEDLLGGEEPPRLERKPTATRQNPERSRADVLPSDRSRVPIARTPEGRQGAPVHVAHPAPVLSQKEEVARAKRGALLAVVRDPMVSRGVRDVEGFWRGDVKDGEHHWGVIERFDGARVLVALDDRVHIGDVTYKKQAVFVPARDAEQVDDLSPGVRVRYRREGERVIIARSGETKQEALARSEMKRMLTRASRRGVQVERGVRTGRGEYLGHFKDEDGSWLVMRQEKRIALISLGTNTYMGDSEYARGGGVRPVCVHESPAVFEEGDPIMCSSRREEIHVVRLVDRHEEELEKWRAQGYRVVENPRKIEGEWCGAAVARGGKEWGYVREMTRINVVRLSEQTIVRAAVYDEKARMVHTGTLPGVGALERGDVVRYMREGEREALIQTPEREEVAIDRAWWPTRLQEMRGSGLKVTRDVSAFTGEYRGYFEERGETHVVLRDEDHVATMKIDGARIGDTYQQGEGVYVPGREYDSVNVFEVGDTLACGTHEGRAHLARVIDACKKREDDLRAGGVRVKRMPREFEGRWEGVEVNARGERWGFIREEKRVSMVRLDDKLYVKEARYDERANLVPTKPLDGPRELSVGDLIRYKREKENSVIARVSEPEARACHRLAVSIQVERARQKGVVITQEHEKASGLYRARFVDSGGRDWLVLERENERVLVPIPKETRVGDVAREGESQVIKLRTDGLEGLKVGDRVTFEKMREHATLLRDEKDERDLLPYAPKETHVPLHASLARGRRAAQVLQNDAEAEVERMLQRAIRNMNRQRELEPERSARSRDEVRADSSERSANPERQPVREQEREKNATRGEERASARPVPARDPESRAMEPSSTKPRGSAPERSARMMEEGEKIKGVVSEELVTREARTYRVVRARDEDILVPEKITIARLEGERAHIEAFRLPNGEMGHAVRGIDVQRDMGRDRNREKP